MELIHTPGPWKAQGGRTCLAIGFFDGVHLGHQQVIRQAVADAARLEAQSVVVTFDRHPASIVAPEHAPALIYPLTLKLEAIAALGVECVWLCHFDETLSRQPAETFVDHLLRDFARVTSVCVGSNFKFGHQRRGNVDLLRRLGVERQFQVHGLAAVSLDGELISSTRVRDCIRQGQLDSAEQMLGRPYALVGRVVRGDQLGRKFGVPTANLDVQGLVVPPGGVYAVHATVGRMTYRAVVNIGSRPTLRQPEPALRVEAHLLDFDGDLYDRELRLAFVQRLRDERAFPSLSDLRAQIDKDMDAARAAFETA